ncbi:hypothetical protein ACTFIV_004951 [Dictyostelium citrinum]
MNSPEELFFKVWRNVYLNYQIFKHLVLYKENRIKCFNSLKEIREYRYKEYIESLSYIGDEPLVVGDLSVRDNFQVLKKVKIDKYDLNQIEDSQFFNISPLLFPMGVEEIVYPFFNNYHPTILKGLPNSVRKVRNVFLTSEVSSEMIPNSIETLYFGYFHDQRLLKGAIQSNIKELYIPGYNSNHQLSEGDICDGVESFEMAGYSQQAELTFKKGVLPNTITKLRIYHPNFSDQYTDEQLLTDRVIPTSVKSIIIEAMSDGMTLIKDFIPPSVTELFLMGSEIIIKPNSLPCNLSLLILDDSFNTKISVGMLPSSLKELKFHSDIQFEHGSLPNALEIFRNNHSVIRGECPNNSWNQKIGAGFFPPSIAYIDFGKSFNQEIQVGDLPSGANLKTIKFGRYFTQSIIPFSIPNTVTDLDLGESLTNPPLLPNSIPSSVIKLTLSEGFVKSLQSDSIPTTVKELYYRGDFIPNPSFISSSINVFKI